MFPRRYLDYILTGGLLLVLLTPLIFGEYLLFPFVVYRTYFFYILVDILFVFFAVRYGRELKKIVREPVIALLFVFIAVKILTDLVNPYSSASFWGNYERMMGLLTWLHLGAYAVMLATVFRTKEQYRLVLKALVIVGGLVALYGLLQKFQIAFRIADIDPRLFSTIGNPAFLAGFLLFIFFFGAYLTYTERGMWRIVFLVITLFAAVSMYFTATRGALLGAFVGVLIVCLYGFFYGGRQVVWKRITMRKISIFFLVVLVAVPFILFAAQGAPFIRSSVTLRRLSDISLTDFTSRSRLVLWQMGLNAVKERWWVGYGEGNLAAALDRQFDPRLKEQWFDSAHNVFIDILLAHGVVDLIAYVALLILVLRIFYRLRKDDPVLSACGVAVLLAYIVQGFFILDTLVTLLPLMVLVGYAAVINKRDDGIVGALRANWVLGVVTFIVVLILLIAYQRSVYAEYFLTRAHRTIRAGSDVSSAIADIERSRVHALFGYHSSAMIVRDMAIRVAEDARYGAEDVARMMRLVQSVYSEARQKEQPHSQLFVDEAKVYLSWRDPDNPFIDEALAQIDEGIRISPRRVDLYYAKAQALYQNREIDGAIRTLGELLSVFPSEAGEIEGKYDILSRVAIERKDWYSAEQIFLRMLDHDPINIKILSNLAQAYKAMGNKEKAIETAERLRSLDPRLEDEIKTFINSL